MLAITEGMNDVGDLAAGRVRRGWFRWRTLRIRPRSRRLLRLLERRFGRKMRATFTFFAQGKTDAPPGYEDLYAMTVADGSVRDLSDGFDGSIGHDEPMVAGDAAMELVEMGFHTTLMRFVGGRREPQHFDTATVSQFNTNAKHTAWVWLGSSSNKPMALYYAEKLGEPGRVLNTPNLLPADWSEVASQRVSWKSDAFTIEGILYLPRRLEGQGSADCGRAWRAHGCV